jgi:hypothetical protein
MVNRCVGISESHCLGAYAAFFIQSKRYKSFLNKYLLIHEHGSSFAIESIMKASDFAYNFRNETYVLFVTSAYISLFTV